MSMAMKGRLSRLAVSERRNAESQIADCMNSKQTSEKGESEKNTGKKAQVVIILHCGDPKKKAWEKGLPMVSFVPSS